LALLNNVIVTCYVLVRYEHVATELEIDRRILRIGAIEVLHVGVYATPLKASFNRRRLRVKATGRIRTDPLVFAIEREHLLAIARFSELPGAIEPVDCCTGARFVGNADGCAHDEKDDVTDELNSTHALLLVYGTV
jgi:hypothetical protein